MVILLHGNLSMVPDKDLAFQLHFGRETNPLFHWPLSSLRQGATDKARSRDRTKT